MANSQPFICVLLSALLRPIHLTMGIHSWCYARAWHCVYSDQTLSLHNKRAVSSHNFSYHIKKVTNKEVSTINSSLLSSIKAFNDEECLRSSFRRASSNSSPSSIAAVFTRAWTLWRWKCTRIQRLGFVKTANN